MYTINLTRQKLNGKQLDSHVFKLKKTVTDCPIEFNQLCVKMQAKWRALARACMGFFPLFIIAITQKCRFSGKYTKFNLFYSKQDFLK